MPVITFQLKFLPVTTNVGAYMDKNAELFGTGDFPLRLFIVWGLKKQDVSGCDPSDSDCTGKTVFNNKLNLNDRNAQLALKVQIE